MLMPPAWRPNAAAATALALLVLAAGLTACAGHQRGDRGPAGQPPPGRVPGAAGTQLHRFLAFDRGGSPALPVSATESGSCFASSLADPLPGAWRCSTGNTLRDPCFAADPAVVQPTALLCANDPLGPVVRLVVTTALPPADRRQPAGGQPWAVRLTGGLRCVSPGGGTRDVVDGQPVTYVCGPAGAGGTVVGPLDRGGAPWQADFVPPGATVPTRVSVTDAWS